MKTITLTGTKVMTGELVTVTVNVIGFHQKANAPIIKLNQITDDEWQELAKKLQGVR